MKSLRCLLGFHDWRKTGAALLIPRTLEFIAPYTCERCKKSAFRITDANVKLRDYQVKGMAETRAQWNAVHGKRDDEGEP